MGARSLLLLLLLLCDVGARARTGKRMRFMGSNAIKGAITNNQYGRWYRDSESNNIQNAIGNFHHEALYPRFAEPIPNVTVTVGGDALLACVVDNLRSYKVAWVRVDTQTILSIHHHVITQNPRISLSHADHRSWILHVRDVQEADRGWYMCQVNTDPMRSRQGFLQVVVAPRMVDHASPSEVIVREASNVTLSCRAQGHPEPRVTWRREDGGHIPYAGRLVYEVPGEELRLPRVSRLHTGAYLCVASNGVPPSVSRRVQLRVQFPPMLSIPSQLEAAYLGQDVSLECHSEAYPASVNYWATERGDMIISGDKYEAVTVDSGYHKYMLLKIRAVAGSDFGAYRCVASNPLGDADGVVKLDEIPAPSTKPPTTPALATLPTSLRKKVGSGSGEAPPESHVLGVFGLEEWRDSEYGVEGEFALPSQRPRTQSATHRTTASAWGPASALALLSCLLR